MTQPPHREKVLLLFEIDEHGCVILTRKMRDVMIACVEQNRPLGYSVAHVLVHAPRISENDIYWALCPHESSHLLDLAKVVRPALFGDCPTERVS